MKSTSRDGDFGASRTVLDHLRAADVALRREAQEAVEAGNLETFTTLVAEYLRAPPRDCLVRGWRRSCWTVWIGTGSPAHLADPPGPVATGLPPVGLEG